MITTIEDWKTVADICKDAATAVALCIGGIWTYLIFVQKRERYPRAKILHSAVALGRASGKQILRVTVHVENLGNVLLHLSMGEVRVQSLGPLPPEWNGLIAEGRQLERTPEFEFNWPLIDRFTLKWSSGYIVEPSESEEFNFDLCVDETITSIQTYSYFKDISQGKREIGWNATTVHHLSKEEDHDQKPA